MKALELYKALTEKIPTSLSCEWDHDGPESCPDPDKKVSRVLVALDVHEGVIEKAASEGFDVIACHHPVFFGSLDGVSTTTVSGGRAVKLVRNGISVMSFHTRLDALDGGVNDTLAALVGLKNVTRVEADKDGIMRIGDVDGELTAKEFAVSVKDKLSCGESGRERASVILADAGKRVKRVALIGGSGGDYIYLAKEAGADTYITGDIKHHQSFDSGCYGVNVLAAGHFFTEYPVCRVLADKIREICPDAYVEVYFSNTTETI